MPLRENGSLFGQPDRKLWRPNLPPREPSIFTGFIAMHRLSHFLATAAFFAVFAGCGPDTSITTTDPPPPMTEEEIKAQEQHYQQPSMADRK
tara:strand:+ start:193 stop:468 length:276 start_codon:yes stop_codon:yes gene_type:complete